MTATSSGVANTPSDDENRRDQRQQRRNGSGDALRLCAFTACDERRVHGDERRRQRAFTEQILQKIRNPEGRHERVRRIGQAEILGEEPLADETGEAAAENAEGYERGRAVHGLYASPQRRRDAKNLFNGDRWMLAIIGGSEPFLPVIAELEGDAEVVAAEQPDDVLQLVFGGRGDAQLIALDAGLHLLQLLILEELDDVARGVARESPAEA